MAQLGAHSAGGSKGRWFGYIDTEMVKVGFAEELGERFKATFPNLLIRPVGPDFAAAAVVRGIERRSPRIIAPRRWVPLSVLRGLVNPLLDRRTERNATIQGVVHDADRTRAPVV